MENERNVTIEPEKDGESAFSTFLSAAPEMPIFSDAELAKGLDRRWRRRTAKLFRRVEAKRLQRATPR